jgi:O-antigen/teichoic acid export membrane protein
MANIVKSSLGGKVFAFTSFNFINACIPFLLLPFLTSYLSKADFAMIGMFQLMTSVALPFLGLNTNSSLVRSYYDRGEIADLRSYTCNVLIILFATAPILLLLVAMFGKEITWLSGIPGKYLSAIVFLALLQKMSELILSLWRAEQSVLKFGLYNMAKAGLDLGASIYMIAVLKHSWEGRIEGQVSAYFVLAICAIFFLIKEKRISLRVNLSYMKHAIVFGSPLIFHVLSAIVVVYSDRLFIKHMVGDDELGLYTVGFQIGMVIGLLQNSFNQAWTPWLFEKLNDGSIEIKRRIVKITYAYVGVILGIVGAFHLITPFIVGTFVDDKFSGAIQFVPWVALGFAANGMYKMFVGYLFYLKETSYIAGLTVVTAVVNIVLNYLLISSVGAIGAAYATCISFLLQALLAWGISSRLYPMPWFGLKI